MKWRCLRTVTYKAQMAEPCRALKAAFNCGCPVQTSAQQTQQSVITADGSRNGSQTKLLPVSLVLTLNITFLRRSSTCTGRGGGMSTVGNKGFHSRPLDTSRRHAHGILCMQDWLVLAASYLELPALNHEQLTGSDADITLLDQDVPGFHGLFVHVCKAQQGRAMALTLSAMSELHVMPLWHLLHAIKLCLLAALGIERVLAQVQASLAASACVQTCHAHMPCTCQDGQLLHRLAHLPRSCAALSCPSD